MANIDKIPRADAVLKNLPDEEQAEIFSWFKATDDRKAMTLEQALAALGARGISVSLSSLSEWRSWYSLARRMERAKARAEQARLELVSQSPDITPEKLEQVAQMVFTAETIEGGDIKAYVQLAALRLKAKEVDISSRRLRMLEAKAARLDEMERKAREAKAGGLSAETLEFLEKQLKLL